MFSSLVQGSSVYILDKTDGVKFKVGNVVSVSAPRTNYNPTFNTNSFIDLKIDVDGNIFDYNNIPSSNSTITYNNGRITISENKLGLQSEVESLIRNSKLVIENISTYLKNIDDCEKILKELDPSFARDKERDDRLNILETKFEGVEDKLLKILTLIQK